MTVKALVIGHGSSYRDYDYIRNFDGPLLCVDVSTLDLIAHDIIPDYQLWSETQEGIKNTFDINLPFAFAYKKIREKMTIVYRVQILTAFVNKVSRFQLKYIVFNAEKYGNTNAINNVGLYSIVFADEVLHADEVHLIGLDFKGSDYSKPVYDSWIASTLHYYNNKTSNCKIIDHSGGDFPKYKE